jgi:serine/threonine protein kinase
VVGTAKPLPQLPQIIAPLTSQGRAFLRSLLVYDPKHRPAAAASLLHNWFSSNPQPLSHASMMPQFDEAKKAEWARKKSKSKVKRNAAAATAAGGAE